MKIAEIRLQILIRYWILAQNSQQDGRVMMAEDHAEAYAPKMWPQIQYGGICNNTQSAHIARC